MIIKDMYSSGIRCWGKNYSFAWCEFANYSKCSMFFYSCYRSKIRGYNWSRHWRHMS